LSVKEPPEYYQLPTVGIRYYTRVVTVDSYD